VVDRRRGLPNNRLWDPAVIPDFHPQIHLNNDAGKLSRLMVATRKYKGNDDMKASRRKATWFNMQKPVVNNYALGILVLRSQHLLKVLTLIASRSLTVTDSQPNKIHFDKPTKPRVCHRSFPTQPVCTPRLDSITYYARPYPYRLMIVLFSWVVAP
jgi:hypothetical protein